MVIYLVDHKRYTSIESARKAAIKLAKQRFSRHPRQYRGDYSQHIPDKELMVAIRTETGKPYGAVVVVPEYARTYRPPLWYKWDSKRGKTMSCKHFVTDDGKLIPNNGKILMYDRRGRDY